MILALALSAMLAQAAPARSPPQPTPEQGTADVEGVVVQGRRLSEAEQRKAVSDFVRELSAPTHRRRLARWNRDICPGVVGLPARYGGYIAERIAEEARAVGLRVGAAGCAPASVLVLFTPEPDKAARDFKVRHPTFFAHQKRSATLYMGGGDQSLSEFLTKDAAVRWWHVAELKGSDGRGFTFVEQRDEYGIKTGVRVPVLENAGASRLASSTREDFARALIIVDTTKLKGVTYEALASYLAMAALAQLDPEAAPAGLPTITALFADVSRARAPVDTLTEWDRAYLKGLYDAPDNARNLNSQQGAIRRSLQQVSEPSRE